MMVITINADGYHAYRVEPPMGYLLISCTKVSGLEQGLCFDL